MVIGTKRVSGLDCHGAYGCVHPHPIYHDGRVLMFYTPYPPESEELPYLAVSDDGLHFKPACHGPLLRRGNWDSSHLADVDVVKSREWLLYYAGASRSGGKKRVSIGVAKGDGKCSWEKVGIAIRGKDIASTPTVFESGGTYFMYYSVIKDGVPILVGAESDDGISFGPPRPVLAPYEDWNTQGVNHPHVSLIGDEILLLFVGYDGVCYSLGVATAKMDDPFNLTMMGKEPLMSNRKGVFCKAREMKSLNRMLVGLKRLYQFYSRLLTSRWRLPSPFWRSLHIYRSAVLTTPDRRVLVDQGSSYLYFSAYDGLLATPSIGVARVLF